MKRSVHQVAYCVDAQEPLLHHHLLRGFFDAFGTF